MPKILIDTTVFFEKAKGEKYVQEIQALFQSSEKFLTKGVLFEMSILIKNVKGSKASALYLENLLKTCEIIEATNQDFDTAFEIMKKYEFNNFKKEFSLCDGVQLALADRLGVDLHTLDEAMSLYKPSNSKCQVKGL
jgi:predicted nucleic acid-binding protein